jgi:ABC-type antimicrobial peptide transport system permease subunit
MWRESSGLVARSITRSWRQHPLRAVSTIAAAITGVVLTTLVVGVIVSILAAVRGGSGFDALHADLVVASRSPGGLDPQLVRSLTEAASPAAATPVAFADTRLAGHPDAVLTVIGLPDGAEGLVPRFKGAELATLQRAARYPLAVSRQWARSHGLHAGSTVRLTGPSGGQNWTVAFVTDRSLPNNGAVALAPIGALRAAFQRPPNADALLITRAARPDRALQARLTGAGGQAVIVGSARQVIAPEESSFAEIRQILLMTGMMGLITAGAVLFVCWRLTIEDERDNIARLRLIGVRPSALAAGAAVVFGGVTVLALLVGIPLGLLGAGAMASFSRTVVNLTGLAASPAPPAPLWPALAGLAAGLGVSALAWASGLRSFLRVPPISAVRQTEAGSRRSTPAWALLAGGAGATLCAVFLSRTLPARLNGAALVFAIAAALLFAAALPVVAGYLLRRKGGFLRLSAGRELAGGRMRRSGTVGVLAVALILAIAMFGLAGSLGNGLRSSINAWTHGDLYVMPAQPGANLRDEKFPPSVTAQLRSIPSVETVVPFTLATIKYQSRNVQLYAWGTDGVESFVHMNVANGLNGQQLWSALDRGGVAVSTNFSWLHHLHVGDLVTLPTPTGSLRAPIVATVRDYTGDTGIIFTSYNTYGRVTGDARSFDLVVKVKPGADVRQVAQDIRGTLSEYSGLTVWTGAQMRNHLMGLLGQVLSVLQLLGLACLALAVLVGMTTAVASLPARKLSIGLTGLLGAPRRLIATEVTGESLAVGALAWVVAFPIGLLSVGILIHAVGAQSGTFPPVAVPVTFALAMLLAALAAAGVAVWLPSRRLLHIDIADQIRYE